MSDEDYDELKKSLKSRASVITAEVGVEPPHMLQSGRDAWAHALRTAATPVLRQLRPW